MMLHSVVRLLAISSACMMVGGVASAQSTATSNSVTDRFAPPIGFYEPGLRHPATLLGSGAATPTMLRQRMERLATFRAEVQQRLAASDGVLTDADRSALTRRFQRRVLMR